MKTTSFWVKVAWQRRRAKRGQSIECRLRRTRTTNENAFIRTSGVVNTFAVKFVFLMSLAQPSIHYPLFCRRFRRHCRVRSSFFRSPKKKEKERSEHVRALAVRVLCASLLFRFGRFVLVFIAGTFCCSQFVWRLRKDDCTRVTTNDNIYVYYSPQHEHIAATIYRAQRGCDMQLFPKL